MGRFGRNVANDKAVAGTREASVCNQRHMVSQILANKRGCHTEHFAHTGAASGAFIADDNNIAFINAARLDDREAIFFTIKNARRAFKEKRAMSCKLYHAAFRGEVAVKNTIAAALFHGRVPCADNILALSFRGVHNLFE